MNGTLMLYLDQYGNHFYARTVRELREKVGSSGSRIAKMYVENGADGEPRHVGYVIAGHWLKMFAPIPCISVYRKYRVLLEESTI